MSTAQQSANAELRAAQNALNADLAALSDAADRADQLLADELWPEDSELVVEIRATFMREWGMDEQQADARMSRFDYRAALAEMGD